MSTYLKEASDYLSTLAEKHKALLHGNDNKAFCRYSDQSQFEALRMNASKNIVVVLSFFGNSDGDAEEACTKNTIVVRFSCYSKTVNSTEIIKASEKALEILLDFWSRMIKDLSEDFCAWLRNIFWEEIQIDEIQQPWLQNHYGWDMVIPFRSALPEYDADKWTN